MVKGPSLVPSRPCQDHIVGLSQHESQMGLSNQLAAKNSKSSMRLDEAGTVLHCLQAWGAGIWNSFFLILVLCKLILQLFTEHYTPCSEFPEQDCCAGFQGVGFTAQRGLWAELTLLSFSSHQAWQRISRISCT